MASILTQAYQKWEAKHGVEKLAPSGQGFTNEQLFFISYAQVSLYWVSLVCRRAGYGDDKPKIYMGGTGIRIHKLTTGPPVPLANINMFVFKIFENTTNDSLNWSNIW